MGFKRIQLFLILVLACLGTSAQIKGDRSIAGFVCTRGTSVRVAEVQVVNLRTKEIKITDDQGTFMIKAAIGDTLAFSKYDYTTNRIPVTGIADMVVFLNEATMLKTVTVKGQTKQQEMNSIMSDYNKKGVYYGGKPSVGSVISSPLNGLYSLFGREPKNARRFAEYAKREEEAAQDSRRYNKGLIKKITGLPDEEVQIFYDAYKPHHADLMKMNEYDVMKHIKKSLEDYKKGPIRDLPKLVSKDTIIP
ncbi:hypothetical protein [Mucilaginibacter myungsuensis]|uniref:Carboxypeptidase-like protein n=1 Tax=Mucilaginibacter myungsuensis TaxID=649104 RepID=A0A929KWC1_9SPHI|nr:hypothetical protein [Mucilaginibacter myungsuensis]MBE9661118.1 hypothetical protein [Mucilaginibacter myungsuensis]MDN3597263.1 hypothetical protein [Mucilaginibacter myungsuensis]